MPNRKLFQFLVVLKVIPVLLLLLGMLTSTMAQNVGIGTTTPLEKLSVESPYGYGISHQALGIKLSTYIDASGAYIGTVSDHPLHFYTNNGTAQMTINDFGNVGIGTQIPIGKLDIWRNSTLTLPTLRLFETGSDFARLRFMNTNNGYFWDMAGYIYNTHALSKFNFYHSVAGDVMTLTGSGNVGIANTAPTEKLDVNGAVKANSLNVSGIVQASAYNYNVTKTGYYPMPACSFQSSRTSANAFIDDGISAAYIINTAGDLVAPVNLPKGSTITNFKVYYLDIASSYNLEFLLQRRLHSAVTWENICILSTTGSNGYDTAQTSSISNSLVDNSQYTYRIDAHTDRSGFWPNILELALNTALITYTTTSPD